MATTCGYGRIKDLRVTCLCIGGKEIIDSKRNISANNVTNKNTFSKYIKSTGTICGPKIKTSKICEKNTGDQVVIEKPLFLNQHGISKIKLSENYLLTEDDYAVLDPDDWEIEFESQGPPSLKQNGHLFTVPSIDNYTNLNNVKVLIEIHVSLKFASFGFDSQALVENEIVRFSIEKNKPDLNNSENDHVVSQITHTPLEFFGTNALSLSDIIVCEPGDTLDISAYIDSHLGKIDIDGNNLGTCAVFKIIGFDNTIE